jgi:hypothetical protein
MRMAAGSAGPDGGSGTSAAATGATAAGGATGVLHAAKGAAPLMKPPKTTKAVAVADDRLAVAYLGRRLRPGHQDRSRDPAVPNGFDRAAQLSGTMVGRGVGASALLGASAMSVIGCAWMSPEIWPPHSISI